MSCFNYIISAIIILILTYKYLTRNFAYWKNRGIPTADGVLPGFGHMLSVFALKKNMPIKLHEIYASSTASMVGIFDKNQPVLLIRDLELVKTVLQMEFSSFSDHRPLDLDSDPLLGLDPFFVNGEAWKRIRGIFTSAFSSKKLKFIGTVAKYESDNFVKFIDQNFNSEDGKSVELDVKVLFSKFTAQVGANAILGVDGNAFVGTDPPESLRAMMNSILEINTLAAIRQNIVFLLPFMSKMFKVGFVPAWVNETFAKMVADIRAMRKHQSLKREDLLQHIIDYEGGSSASDGADLVAPSAFSFFIESYESSSLTLSAAAYLLSKHPDVQDRAREEVVKQIEQHGGISYESVSEMIFLEQIFRETMRLFSPVGRFSKICSKAITLQGPDGLSCALKPGDEVLISVSGIHRDPEIWENPDEFNPDRFAKDSPEKKRKFAFLAFGEGPRICPGMRMGFLQIKAAIATILKNYVIKPSTKMVEPVQVDPRYFLTAVVGGFWVQLERL
ncbi:GSCOCT00002505001.2-RA-CDS [Cotesia congregata]|uniref:CYP336G2 n=1 Tax=Cotesia congregata TaxID=51543 RepID=A0A8J2MGM2_COTCN|nr:GSCOCT00002505001.2-RA-CDS [Cotesia congregata]CAG5081302.1 CYP336G2 [Cotesia congregata]